MQWLHKHSYLQLESLLLKMTATVMTVEFGTIYRYSSLEEHFVKACLRISFEQIKRLTEHYVDNDILIQNKPVLNSNMNTN